MHTPGRSTGILILSLVFCMLFPAALGAQNAPTAVNDTRLTQLYQAYLTKGKSDAYLEKRISDELKGIRKQIDAEVKSLITIPAEEQTADSAALSNALERQRGIVATLESSAREARIDVDLLEEEERNYYLKSATGTGETLDDLRTTGSYAELLAKKAVLGQRIESIEMAATVQKDRLNKLADEQRFQQFRGVFDIGWYLAIIALAVLVDRLLRAMLIGKIERNTHRYLASKIITAVTYCGALLWIAARLIAEHPGAFASLAIVGAGIAVALQSIVKDLFGWMVIFQRRYYSPGDRVTIGQFTGDVVDIGPLRTTLLESSSTLHPNSPERFGRVLYVPNSQILSQEVLNFNAIADYAYAEMYVTITSDSDWRAAEKILLDVVTKETHEYVAKASKQQHKRMAHLFLPRKVSEPTVDMEATEYGYKFILWFTVPIGQRRTVVTRLWHVILERFEQNQNIRVSFRDTQAVQIVSRP